MATLNVGAGQTYATVSAAVNAARSGDVIAVQAGTYTNDFATITKDITITGVGGMANFVATVAPPNGKGIFVTNGNVTLEHLSFSGAAVADGNGAGVRYEGGNLVVIDSYFHNNQDGLLANAVPNGTIRIVDSEFGFNGIGDGYTHNLYVNNIASLVIDNSYFHDANLGHEIKSRAQSTTITNSRIYDGTSTASYSIDLPNGGVGVIRGNVIQQGANSDNPAIIHLRRRERGLCRLEPADHEQHRGQRHVRAVERCAAVQCHHDRRHPQRQLGLWPHGEPDHERPGYRIRPDLPFRPPLARHQLALARYRRCYPPPLVPLARTSSWALLGPTR